MPLNIISTIYVFSSAAMPFRKPTNRIFLLWIVITMIMYHFTSLLVEYDTSHPATNVWKIADSVRLVPSVSKYTQSFLPQSPLDDELLRLQLLLVRLVEYFEYSMNRDLTLQQMKA